MLERNKEDMKINPRIISNKERAQFLKPNQTIKWMKKDGSEFDFEQAIFNFFQVIFCKERSFNFFSARKIILDLLMQSFFQVKRTNSSLGFEQRL